MGSTSVFAERKGSEVAYDKKNFVEFFTMLADAVGLSLRARERCITRLRVVMDLTPPNHYLDPILVALLIVLRSNKQDLFNRLISGEAHAETVMEYLASLPNGEKFKVGRAGIGIYAYLIASDLNEKRSSALREKLRADAENDTLSAEVRDQAIRVLRFIESINSGMRMEISLAPVAAKIDLAAMVKE